MNNKVFRIALIAALAGFLFGFDTVVISGAEKALQLLWHTSDTFHGTVVIGMALFGTVLGAIFGGIPTNQIGRKKTLIGIGLLYTLSAVGSALANDPISFGIFRFLGGLGIGASTVAAPTYISEISPAQNRGKLVGLYQFNIVFGILVAYLSNYLLSGTGEYAWRWMMGVEAFPALLYTLFTLNIPKSPRWLLTRGRTEEAQNVLTQLNMGTNMDAMKKELEAGAAQNASSEHIFLAKYRFPLILVFLIAFFNQFSGINAFLYYAPRIFELAGLGESTALLSSIGIGITNLLFTLLGIYLIDRLGRRTLMYFGSFGYIVSLSLVAAAFMLNWSGMAVPLFLFVFIASHAIGQGAVIWVFISEVFPNRLRGSGQAFGSSVHWVLAWLIPSAIPYLMGTIGPGPVFVIFALMMVLQLLFVHFMMPETKGLALEDLSSKLARPPRKNN
ncbi:MAG: hypothetical protein RLZZ241_760 [Bacteroidota bacterium]|jgi:sugar porter (SP) family MFS transporter